MKVLLFSLAREAADGRSVLNYVRTPVPADLGELLARLEQEYPRLGPVLARSRVAVNGEYLPSPDRRTKIAPKDEVAILPPYSGG